MSSAQRPSTPALRIAADLRVYAGDAVGESLLEKARAAQEDPELRAMLWARFVRHIREMDRFYSPAQMIAWHQHALNQLPKDILRKNDEYALIWIGLARTLAIRDKQEARSTFKYMKLERIGLCCAAFYDAWSQFEIKTGNARKASLIMEQGRRRMADGSVTGDQTKEVTTQAFGSKSSPVVNGIGTPFSTPINGSQTNAASIFTGAYSTPGPSQLIPSSTPSASLFTPLPNSTSAGLCRLPQTESRPQSADAAPTAEPTAGSSSNTAPLNRAPLSSRRYDWAQLSPSPERDRASNNTPAVTSKKKIRFQDAASPTRRPKEADLHANKENEAVAFQQQVTSPLPANSGRPVHRGTTPPQVTSPLPVANQRRLGTPLQPARRATTPPMLSSTAPAVGLPNAARGVMPPLSARSTVVESASRLTTPASASHSTIAVNGISYLILEMVGKGGSGQVYKVVGENKQIYAVKRVKLKGDAETLKAIRNEISLLKKLKGRSTIIELIDSQEDLAHNVIWMVFEFGEIDLARMLRNQNGQPVNINYVRTYWQQMVEAVQTIHDERVVHSDLKPANFMIVKGSLKLIDFGIALAIQGDDTNNIVRDSQIGTINYMSPEAMLPPASDGAASKSFKIGRASDIWSLGCILYQMVYGRTPFHDLNFVQKVHAITNPNHSIPFDIPSAMIEPSLLAEVADVIRSCLRRNPAERPSIPDLLRHPFLTTIAARPAVQSVRKDQIQSLIAQLAASGSSIDLSDPKIVDMIHWQLQQGVDIDINSNSFTSTRKSG